MTRCPRRSHRVFVPNRSTHETADCKDATPRPFATQQKGHCLWTLPANHHGAAAQGPQDGQSPKDSVHQSLQFPTREEVGLKHHHLQACGFHEPTNLFLREFGVIEIDTHPLRENLPGRQYAIAAKRNRSLSDDQRVYIGGIHARQAAAVGRYQNHYSVIIQDSANLAQSK